MKKALFDIPEGITYLDGNSLGPLPHTASARIDQAVRSEWGQMLIKGWNEAGWMTQPAELGDRIGALIGCPAGSVMVGDTLSIKVYQALAAALKMRPDRKIILSDNGNFPTDLYMADGLLQTLGQGHELKVVDPLAVQDHINEDVAVLMLTHVDYRTGRMYPMNTLTEKAQQAGAVVMWDLAHSAGAVPVDMTQSRAEFAMGCTYKYLNAGPGAPAFIYARPDISDIIQPSLAGWLGHASPFTFALDYQPAPGVQRLRVGTPSVIQMAALEAALDIWDDVSVAEVRARSIELSERFIAEVEARCPALTLVSPRAAAERGSQVSFRFEHGYAAMQALIAKGVIGDFRAPDVMRFGFTPLYLEMPDVLKAVDVLEDVMIHERWAYPAFQTRAAVT